MFAWVTALIAAVQHGRRVIYQGSHQPLFGAVVVRVEPCDCAQCPSAERHSRVRALVILAVDVEHVSVQEMQCVRLRSFHQTRQ